MIGHLIEAIFHLCGKIVVHQIAEVFFQTVGDDFTHFFSVKAAVLGAYIAAVLDGRNDRRISGRTTDAAFFQLFYQRGFAETRRRFGEVLRRCQFHQAEAVALIDHR